MLPRTECFQPRRCAAPGLRRRRRQSDPRRRRFVSVDSRNVIRLRTMGEMDMYKELQDGYQTAFIDYTHQSNLAYRPEFLSNDHERGRKVLSTLEQELANCDEFKISVAFITQSGITPLLQTLEELERRQIPGQILTTDYLTFSEPKALETLASLRNIELRMFRIDGETSGFHTKGYIFRQEEIYRVIIGSSNMTQSAITTNREWNTKLVSTKDGEVIREILGEFDDLWNSPHTQGFAEFIDSYRLDYLRQKMIRKQQRQASREQVVSIDQYTLKPNKMQVAFLQNILEMRSQHVEKALLLSATGTGKTLASAFAMRELAPERMLVLVHREQIAKQSIKSYQRVFGTSKEYGLLSGNSRETGADYLFSTMQMMSKPEVYDTFDPECFDVIVLDECHHAGAESYQRIMRHFRPKFWLGMTASPDTNQYDIYSIFDHNIAYEIRLQQALEEDLLCPFHYFGITDLEIDGEVFDDQAGVRNFSNLISDDRVRYVIEKAEYFGYSGDRVKGLIFCSRTEEARELSAKFNRWPKKNGGCYRTAVLTGEDSQARREEMIERLAGDDREDQLDYIFTVDIFNEGVDVPELNQVIMLRPTQSPVVFVQQLGRGLRKAEDKEFVVILDFIGNYKNNFMIPIALSGDRSYNKDNVRRYLMEGTRVIPGSSTIHFDEISRKRIFSAIDSVNFSDIKLIKENYKRLKFKLGRIPGLMDFDRYGEMDVLRIFDSGSLGSYYKFLVKYEPDYRIRLNPQEERAVEFISKKLVSGKRIHEIELIGRMLTYQTGLMSLLRECLRDEYQIDADAVAARNVVNVLTNEFPAGSGKKTYEGCVFLEEDGGDYRISEAFAGMLANRDFYDIVAELVEFGRHRYRRDYSNRYKNTDLVLYQKYTYEDVCRLLGWEHNEVPLNIGGYKFDRKTKTFPVFINYDKAEDIQDTVKYEDHFVSEDRLIAISKSNRTVQSDDVQNFLHAEERGISVELFVRKNKDDKISKEFYYLGHMTASGRTREFIMPNTTSSAVEIEWILDKPVRSDLYEYITGS